MVKKNRRSRPRRNRATPYHGERKIFAVLGAGKTVEGMAQGVHFPVDRACKVTSVTGRVTLFRGFTALFELVLFNQAATQVATTGVQSVASNGIRFTVRPPRGADMWIDPGHTQNTDLKIFHVDFPCVDKDMATYQILVNMTVHYVAGMEQIANICPTILVHKDDATPESDFVSV